LPENVEAFRLDENTAVFAGFALVDLCGKWGAELWGKLKFRPECFQLALLIGGEALPFNCEFCVHWELVRVHVTMELPLN
jgi:hypothetical protein